MESSLGEILLSGAKLMLVGMGIVYLFLALLVWVIGLNSKLIHRFSSEPSSQPHHPDQGSAGANGVEEMDSELVAAISAAIHHHQNN